MPTSQVILSPHLDDAVFNCWLAINSPGSTVMTIFTGQPPEGTHTVRDFICGEADGKKMVKKRIAENKAALKDTKSTIINLDYLDSQYRKQEPELDDIVASIIKKSPKKCVFLAPISLKTIFTKKDHLLIHRAAMILINKGYKVNFYPDSPRINLPTEMADIQESNLKLLASKSLGFEINVSIKHLTDRQQALKQKAMLTYESQYRVSNIVNGGGLYKIARRDYEVTFVSDQN